MKDLNAHLLFKMFQINFSHKRSNYLETSRNLLSSSDLNQGEAKFKILCPQKLNGIEMCHA